MKNNLNKVKCTGISLFKFINECTNNNVELINLNKIDNQTIEFCLSDKDMKKLKSVNSFNCNLEILSFGGKRKIFETIKFRCGLIIGLLLSLILLFFINNRLINFDISGVDESKIIEINQSLESMGIKKFSLMNFDCEDIENQLIDEFSFSFVSVIKRGNTLIINIKENENEILDYNPITAEYNMIITKINVYSGSTNIKVGDVVFIGDTLVHPYELINNEKQQVQPSAEIEGDVFFSERYDFRNLEKKTVRSGNFKILNMEFYLGNIKLFGNEKKNEFENFEIENQETLLSQYLLPFRVKKTIAYELVDVEYERNFEKEKDNIISELKSKAYSLVPEYLVVEDEKIKISPTKYGNIVTIYLKSSVYLKYNLNKNVGEYDN